MTTPLALPLPTADLDRAERDLRAHGICAVTEALDPAALHEARTRLYSAAQDDRSRGLDTKFVFDYAHDDTNQRVWNLLSRAPIFTELATHPIALRLLRSVLGRSVLLGNFSANITGPGGGEMRIHADQMFVPEPWPSAPQGANAAWCLDDFTADNGATCFVPGSHLRNRIPRPDDVVDAVPMEAPAGSLVVFDSRIWHRTGFNRTTDRHRAAAFAWYTTPIYRTQENWFLALDPAVVQNASDEFLELLGYKTMGLGMVNGRSPR